MAISTTSKGATVLLDGLSPATTYDVYVGYHVYGGSTDPLPWCLAALLLHQLLQGLVSFSTNVYEDANYYNFVKLFMGAAVNKRSRNIESDAEQCRGNHGNSGAKRFYTDSTAVNPMLVGSTNEGTYFINDLSGSKPQAKPSRLAGGYFLEYISASACTWSLVRPIQQ